jgi:hypothetical protein
MGRTSGSTRGFRRFGERPTRSGRAVRTRGRFVMQQSLATPYGYASPDGQVGLDRCPARALAFDMRRAPATTEP